MAPKEPTRAQLSSKLSYQAQKPAFLQKLQNRMAGIDEEFEHVGHGREPIPRRPRPAIPERPADDPGSADEDFDDERPQVVVLKEGKHLSAWAEKGLPPLPDPLVEAQRREDEAGSSEDWKAAKKQEASGSNTSKRKAVGQLDDDEDEPPTGAKPAVKKKPKKQNKKLLSFGDDA
ncbi:hypothetical protein DFP72DRAFT_988650 [Ephemerocybe angulata]|uniref:DUF4604 domain-containing protein n=1 Tax=Ephemerocybe angulata TaxID=980116 RepID=A0A8H6M9F4_9AGAR|nr:hypothetical protein DFP72DRAFT_988650 [Tulosesus angulatus]